MKGWLRLLLVIIVVAITTVIGTYTIEVFAPSGFASYLSQSLSILILSLGITGSSIAVLSGKGIDEYFSRKREEKRVKSAFVSYLSGVIFQIIPIGSVFFSMSEIKIPAIPAQYLDTMPPQLNSLVQSNVEALLRATPIDTSYYERNIKDHLLYLPQQIANRALLVVTYITELNRYYEVLVRDLSSKTLPAKEAFPPAYIISAYLNTHVKAHLMISELGNDVRDMVQGLLNNILWNQEKPLGFKSLQDKLVAANDASDGANKEFIQTLFPGRSSTTASDSPSKPS